MVNDLETYKLVLLGIISDLPAEEKCVVDECRSLLKEVIESRLSGNSDKENKLAVIGMMLGAFDKADSIEKALG